MNYWYRGPDTIQRKEKIFIKNEKVVIINDDDQNPSKLRPQ